MTQAVQDVLALPIEFRAIPPARRIPSLAEDIARGFAQRPRAIPPKYFYDATGSQLFDQICDTPEYYPTRAEAALLAAHAEAIIDRARPDHIIEFGSGSARKTRYLLDACERLGAAVHYWPFDVCESMLADAGKRLRRHWPTLPITALVGDYTGGLAQLPHPRGRRLFVFLGGTLGNFTEAEARVFLRDLRAQARAGDAFLLGADRVKDAARLEAAYDDAAGITAAFNLNVLRVLNRELNADFDLAAFRHRAVYNRGAARIEMYLEAAREQDVSIAALGLRCRLNAGERILTEISRKFTRAGLEALLDGAGFTPAVHFEGGEQLFSLVLAIAAPAGD